MSTPPASPESTTPSGTIGILGLRRGQLLGLAIIGAILGLIGLFFPTLAFIFVAIVFGIYLVASGIFRINTALLAHGLGAVRWLSGLVGLLIVAAGVICLSDPFQSLIVLAYVIGIGWILEGIADVATAARGRGGRRVFGWVSGILSIVAGIVIFVLPAAGLRVFELIGSILLIVVSVSTLLTMPGKTTED
jgi:uncharacterized membrane protein HdeD (DUF308 family)